MSIDSNELIRVLLYGLWMPATFIGLVYLAVRIVTQGYLLSRTRFDKRSQSDLLEEMFYRFRQTDDRLEEALGQLKSQNSFNEAYLTSLFDRMSQAINFELRQLMNTATSSPVRDIQKEINIQTVQYAGQFGSNTNLLDARRSLIREISRALYTPLSRIDAITSNVLASQPSEAVASKMERAKSAVDICYAYISAYRNVINVSEKSSYWAPDSLKDAIYASAEVFVDAAATQLDVEVIAPNSIKSMSNIYMLAILLPLIENAVEATTGGDRISIKVATQGGRLRAEVTNPLHAEFPGDVVFEPRLHHKGGDINQCKGTRRTWFDHCKKLVVGGFRIRAFVQ